MIRSVKSYDGGLSFDIQNPARTPFLSTANCFGVQVDPTDGKTLYLAWGYDNANLSAQNQLPRQRWAIARSTDDGKTWEYLGTSYECTYGGAKNTVMNLIIANDNNGVVFLNGRKVEDAAHNGYILLDCAASYMGATIGADSSGQTTLSYDSKSAVLNGVTNINGVLFVNRESFANQFCFKIYTTQDGVCYLGLVDKMLKSTEDRFKNGIEIAE